jgi:hypothetical protein
VSPVITSRSRAIGHLDGAASVGAADASSAARAEARAAFFDDEDVGAAVTPPPGALHLRALAADGGARGGVMAAWPAATDPSATFASTVAAAVVAALAPPRATTPTPEPTAPTPERPVTSWRAAAVVLGASVQTIARRRADRDDDSRRGGPTPKACRSWWSASTAPPSASVSGSAPRAPTSGAARWRTFDRNSRLAAS